MWTDSERQIESYYHLELKKHLEKKLHCSDEELKRLQILSKVYEHHKLKYLPWFV